MSRLHDQALTAAGLVFCGGLLLAGCSPEGMGFKLPAGDVDRGRAAFVGLECDQCHAVADIERAAASQTGIDIRLGGPVTRVRTYGELVTSVINPSHRIAHPYPPQPVESGGKSRMRNYNDIMTVQQLVDLVTFLEGEYDLRVPPSYL